MRTPIVRSLRTAATMGGLVWLAACTATTKESSLTIEHYITQVSDGTGQILATLRTDDAPVPAGGPINTVSGFPVMVNGGSAQQTVNGASSFSRVIVRVPGASNYYELIVPASASRDIVIAASPDLPSMSLPVAYAVGDAQTIGAYTTLNTRVYHVGNGDIQVSISWSDSSDVDLHVIDPSSEEIYFGHKNAVSGGKLDLDSNAGCSKNTLPDNSRAFLSNENIVWPVGSAPNGSYTVKVTYWSACGVTTGTDYIVTVAKSGTAPLIFHGTLQPPGTGGGAGSGNLITTFTF